MSEHDVLTGCRVVSLLCKFIRVSRRDTSTRDAHVPTCGISAVSAFIYKNEINANDRAEERTPLRDDDVVNTLFEEPIGLRSAASLMANEKVIRGYE